MGGSGTSWTSVLIGWLATLGASLILSGIVTAIVGVILTALGFGGGAEAGTTGLVGILLTLFLAFLIGGYTAGRMPCSSHSSREPSGAPGGPKPVAGARRKNRLLRPPRVITTDQSLAKRDPSLLAPVLLTNAMLVKHTQSRV